MVEDKIYMSTEKQVVGKINDSEILGTITSSIAGTQIPTQNGESNFSYKGAPYVYRDDGLVVTISGYFLSRNKSIA